METIYLNPKHGTIDRKPPVEIDYGIGHFSNIDGSPTMGMYCFHYQPRKSALNRKKYVEEFGPVPANSEILSKIGGLQSDWPKPKVDGYIRCVKLLRRFIKSNNLEKKTILTQKLGFDDPGIKVGYDEDKCDALFRYLFSTEPTQIEIFMGEDEFGTITEINRFHQSKLEELKIPIDNEGLLYMFIQIFADMNRVDFNKLDPGDMTDEEKSFTAFILDLKTYMPQLDNRDVQDFSPLNA